MAITERHSSQLTIPNTVGTYTVSIDVGSNPKVLVCMAVECGSSSYPSIGVPRVDGVALPYIGGTDNTRRTYAWALVGPEGISGVVNATFQLTQAWGGAYVKFFALESSSDLEQFGPVRTEAGSGGGAVWTVETDRVGQALSALSGGLADMYENMTLTDAFGYETVPTTGSRTVGISKSGSHSSVTLMYMETDAPEVDDVTAQKSLNTNPTTWTHSPVKSTMAYVMPYFRRDKYNDLSNVSFGGLAMSLVNGFIDHGANDGYTGLWYNLDISERASDLFSANEQYAYNTGWGVHLSVPGDGPLSLVDTSLLQSNGVNAQIDMELDPQGKECIAFLLVNSNQANIANIAWAGANAGRIATRGKVSVDGQGYMWGTAHVPSHGGPQTFSEIVYSDTTRVTMLGCLIGRQSTQAPVRKRPQAIVLA